MITFEWTRNVNRIEKLSYVTVDQPSTNRTSYYITTSNFCSEPFITLAKYTGTVLNDNYFDESIEFVASDGENNIIGSIVGQNIYRQVFDPNDALKTTLNSVSFPVQAATGIFTPYLNGSITIEYNNDKRTAYLFKK